MIKVLFVCLGNICRSPMAEAIFRAKVSAAGLMDKIEIDSAGTGDWHVGRQPHEGTLNILAQNGIDSDGMRARQVVSDDLKKFDYIIAMDNKNLGELMKLKGEDVTAEISLLLQFNSGAKICDVPDPYYTGNFEEVYNLLDTACSELLGYIMEKENL